MAAFILDAQGRKNWIAPAQLLVMAVIGVSVTFALPSSRGPAHLPDDAL